MKKLLIIGCGGHAKSMVDAIEKYGEYEIAGFVDRTIDTEYEYRGYRIIGADENLEYLYQTGIKYAVVGIGNMGKETLRNLIYAQLTKIGYILPVIIDPSAQIASDVVINAGTFVGKNAVVNSNTTVEEACIINTGAIIEHDVRIGFNTHVAAGAVICGMCQVGKNCLVGANATVIQQVKIGSHSIVGAGAVLLHDVDANSTVYGNPARIFSISEAAQ